MFVSGKIWLLEPINTHTHTHIYYLRCKVTTFLNQSISPLWPMFIMSVPVEPVHRCCGVKPAVLDHRAGWISEGLQAALNGAVQPCLQTRLKGPLRTSAQLAEINVRRWKEEGETWKHTVQSRRWGENVTVWKGEPFVVKAPGCRGDIRSFIILSSFYFHLLSFFSSFIHCDTRQEKTWRMLQISG